jgi:helix-turn-helix protein
MITMNKKKQEALEKAGFRVGDAEDFLELNDAERAEVALRVALSRFVREQRQAMRMTQNALALRLRSSQSRIAKLEAAAADVSLDLMFKGFFATGGRLAKLKGIEDGIVTRRRSTQGKKVKVRRVTSG